MAPEGRGPSRHRLRFPHDCPGPARHPAARDGRDGQAGRHQLQDVHGLPRRGDGGRRHHLQGYDPGVRQRGDDLPARGTRAHDRRAGATSAGPGQYGPQVPRQHPPAGDRGRGHPPGHTHGRDRRRAGLLRPPELHRGAGAGAGGPVPGRTMSMPRPAPTT